MIDRRFPEGDHSPLFTSVTAILRSARLIAKGFPFAAFTASSFAACSVSALIRRVSSIVATRRTVISKVFNFGFRTFGAFGGGSGVRGGDVVSLSLGPAARLSL